MENFKLSRKRFLTGIFLVGLIIPFIPILAFAEVFFGIILFALIMIFGLTYTVIRIVQKKELKNALFMLLVVPFFVSTQILSGFLVHKIQRYRSENIIAEIEKFKLNTGFYPEQYDVKFGIEYSKDLDNYKLEYSRGFSVTEKFYSNIKTWKSYGWND